MATLSFEQVSVRYPVYSARSKSLRNQLVRLSTGGLIERDAGNVEVVTALRDVSFELKDGDAVGLIGHNGAGKSTLLRTMAGVYQPTCGSIVREGRVATMLELGAGLDAELSGEENIVRMGLLMGMSLDEIARKTEAIIQFTQLGEFIRMPVRTYSSGMATRLMFAVATSTEPDILLVDEMFATGDAEFRTRAAERMESLMRSVGIMVFASHDMGLVERYCNRIFVLEHGTVTERERPVRTATGTAS
jgi:lipopolysaccharide transport system ATP-binding protein